jgi:tyrosine-protein kinase Etk/Wzc
MLRQLPPDRRSLHGLVAERPEGAYAAALRATFERITRAFGVGGQVVLVAPVQADNSPENFTLQLAATAAAAGRRVLVIDGDLGRSKISSLLGMDGAGVWDAIQGERPWRACVEQADGLGFDVLPAGISDQQTVREWYGDGRFAALLKDIKSHYDIVLVDTPAALQGPDARMTAALADVAVLIAPWGRTPVIQARRAVHAIADRAPHLRVGLAVTSMRDQARQVS